MSMLARRTTHTPAELTAADWIARRDAGLDPDEQREFERWCEEHHLHREALRRLEATWAALGGPRASGAAGALRRELALVQRERRLRTLKVTAAGILCVAAGWTVLSLRSRAEPTAIVWTPERRTLPDGSKVELPPGSEFTLEFSARERRVSLKRGEAHFEVVADASRPFRVTAGQVEVHALGTAFAVQLSESIVDLIVTEGRVTAGVMRDLATGGGPAPALVSAGHRVTFEPSEVETPQVLAVTDSEIAERLAWRSPRVEFSEAPLSEVVALINRHAPTRLVIGERALSNTALSGVFRLNDIEAFLRMLEKGFGVTVERREHEVILRKAR